MEKTDLSAARPFAGTLQRRKSDWPEHHGLRHVNPREALQVAIAKSTSNVAR